jgi:hypothetical protein
MYYYSNTKNFSKLLCCFNLILKHQDEILNNKTNHYPRLKTSTQRGNRALKELCVHILQKECFPKLILNDIYFQSLVQICFGSDFELIVNENSIEINNNPNKNDDVLTTLSHYVPELQTSTEPIQNLPDMGVYEEIPQDEKIAQVMLLCDNMDCNLDDYLHITDAIIGKLKTDI